MQKMHLAATLSLGVLALVAATAAAVRPPARCLDSFVHNGHNYRIYGDLLSWDNAKEVAAKLTLNGVNGHLVRIDDQAENDIIAKRLQALDSRFTTRVNDGGGARYLWIGATDQAVEGDWCWCDNNDSFWKGGPKGKVVAGRFANWGSSANGAVPNEPDNYGGDQNAAVIALDKWPVQGAVTLGRPCQWNDIKQSNRLPFIVEFDR